METMRVRCRMWRQPLLLSLGMGALPQNPFGAISINNLAEMRSGVEIGIRRCGKTLNMRPLEIGVWLFRHRVHRVEPAGAFRWGGNYRRPCHAMMAEAE